MGNFYMESTQINYRRDEKLKTVDQKLQELSETSAIDTDIAPVFKSTNTYQPGDMVYYRNKLYVFNVEHTGAWAAADVTATDVTSAMNAALSGKADYADLAGAFSAEASYSAGDLVIYNGIVYRCTNDHTGAWDADDFSATTIAAEIDSLKSGLTDVNSNLTSLQNVINSKIVVNIEAAENTDYAYLERVPGRNYLICVNTQGSNGVNGYSPLVGVLRMGYQGQNFSYTPILTSDTYNIDITWDSTESKYKIQEIKTATSEVGINLIGFAVGVNPWT